MLALCSRTQIPFWNRLCRCALNSVALRALYFAFSKKNEQEVQAPYLLPQTVSKKRSSTSQIATERLGALTTKMLLKSGRSRRCLQDPGAAASYQRFDPLAEHVESNKQLRLHQGSDRRLCRTTRPAKALCSPGLATC